MIEKWNVLPHQIRRPRFVGRGPMVTAVAGSQYRTIQQRGVVRAAHGSPANAASVFAPRPSSETKTVTTTVRVAC